MTDSPSALNALRRPSLLIRAARYGLADYNRGHVLAKIFGGRVPAAGEPTLDELLEHERRHEEIRKAGDARYSIASHIEVLVAVMAEARMILRPRAV